MMSLCVQGEDMLNVEFSLADLNTVRGCQWDQVSICSQTSAAQSCRL